MASVILPSNSNALPSSISESPFVELASTCQLCPLASAGRPRAFPVSASAMCSLQSMPRPKKHTKLSVISYNSAKIYEI